MDAPKLNKMTFDELLDHLAGQARSSIPEWSIPKGAPGTWSTSDFGMALMKIFAHMQEDVISRLNRVPDKNFGAFLNMLGVKLMPAQPARVPVTFYPVDGFPYPIFVPAGTPVAASETEAHSSLTYQTSKSFSACDSPIIGIYSINSVADKIYDHLPDLTAQRPFQPFSGNNLQEHVLYLGHSELFNVGGSTDIILRLTFASQPDLLTIKDRLVWRYIGEDGAPKVITARWAGDVDNMTQASLILSGIKKINETKVNGISCLWISCSQNDSSIPLIKDIKIIGLDFVNRVVRPDYAFYNFIPLDIKTKDPTTLELERNIHPFGKTPRPFDSFYIANREVFSKAGAEIKIETDLVSAVATDVSPALTWEYFNGKAWMILSPEADLTVSSLRVSGFLKFHLPSDIQECEVNGVKNYWIRVTITEGDYGHEFAKLVNGKYVIKNNFSPPCLKKIAIALINSNISDSGKSLEHCLAYNNLQYVDLTERTNSDPIGFMPFVQLPGIASKKTLFLGFKNPLLDGNISLFFYVDESQTPSFGPSLKWSYWGGDIKLADIGTHTSSRTKLKLQSSKGFGLQTELMIQESIADPSTGKSSLITENALINSFLDDGYVVLDRQLSHPFTNKALVARRIYLQCQDGTENLTKSNTLDFASPGDQIKTVFLGNEGYWLMASFEGPGNVPQIRGIYPNTVWAEQVEAVEDEILGSSEGERDMTLSLQNRPVVSCEIWVLEGIVFSENDKAQLPEGVSIKEVTDDSGAVVDTRVRWAEVDDLLESDSRSRHYALDHALGEVTFGNGDMGMIPPIGNANIKARYTWGGGVAGNVSAGEINILKEVLAGIDRVANCQPAQGGSDTEMISSALERGPHLIRHRNRAVTKEDYERLTRESSSYVARTKCIATSANVLNIIVIPNGTEDRPTPSQGLLESVKKYLLERSLCSVSPESLRVVAPTYKDIRISVEIYPTSIDLAVPLSREVVKRLNHYLHPLTGGPYGRGWDFGRSIYRSDLYSMLEGISGVDHVGSLTINESDCDLELGRLEMACSGNHNVRISLGA
jgi:hypothetical protein